MRTLITIIAATLAGTLVAAGSAQGQTVVTEVAIHEAAREFVRDHLEGIDTSEERYEINIRWQGDVMLLGEGDPEIAIRRISSQPFRGPTVMRAEIQLHGETVRVLTLTADTRIYRGVLVTMRTIRRGEVFTEDMFDYRERDVTGVNSGYFSHFAELAGLQASRTIGFDRVIASDHAERIPAILRGGEVTLLLETDFMRITTRGKALQDGSVGEQVRVKNEDTGKLLRGEVVDAGTVRIDL